MSTNLTNEQAAEYVKNYALEKFAGDEAAANDFLDAFTKEAMAGRDHSSRGGAPAPHKPETPSATAGIMDRVSQSFTQGVGSGLASILVSAGVAGVGTAAKVISNNNMHEKFLMALEQAIKSNSIVRQADKTKVMSYAETIFKFAPHIATDANLLSSILANAIHGEGIDPMTIKTLSDINGRHADNNAFSPKTYL